MLETATCIALKNTLSSFKKIAEDFKKSLGQAMAKTK